MSAAYPTRYRSQNNKLAGTEFKRESNEYFSPFQLITIKESFLTGSAKTPSVVILDFRALSSNTNKNSFGSVLLSLERYDVHPPSYL